MAQANPSCPLIYEQAVDMYFLEHRAKLIDIAAFLDRLDRATGKREDDYRIIAFHRAIEILREERPGRAARILGLLSDHTTEPIDKAPMKGALGAIPLSAD